METHVALLTTYEVARALGVSRSTVQRLVKRGELRPVRIGHLVRFRVDDLLLLVEGLSADSMTATGGDPGPRAEAPTSQDGPSRESGTQD